MARPFLLACVVLSAWVTSGRAQAPTCACEYGTIVLPAPGSRVPRNTKIWVLDGAIGAGRLEGGTDPEVVRAQTVSSDGVAVAQFAVAPLEAVRRYTFRGDPGDASTWFTTSAGFDTTPPARPRLRSVTMAVAEHLGDGEPVTELTVDEDLDPDVALIRMTFHSDGVRWSVITTPDGWHRLGKPRCNTAIQGLRAPATVTVEIRAIDLAGNESEPAIANIVTAPGGDPHGCARPHFRCGMGDMALVMLAVPALGVLLLVLAIAGIVRSVRRRAARTSAIAEPISLLVVERLARSMQRRGGVVAAIGLVSVPALAITYSELWAIPATIIACIGIRGFSIARGILRLIEVGDAHVTAEVRGPTLYVRGPSHETQFDVEPQVLARARRHAVPASIAKRT